MPNVLIVDDADDTRISLHDVLDLIGDERHYVVAEAEEGKAALDKLRGEVDPTVVLFDFRMPVMDGQEFLEHVLADPALVARCALVWMTASPTELSPAFRAVLAVHAIPVLSKPFDLDDLLAVVAAAADKLRAAS